MKKLHCLFVSKLKEHMKIEIYVRTLRFLSFVDSTKREVASRGTPWEGFVCVDWLTLCFGSSSSARNCLSFFLNLFQFFLSS